jgi:hypothetical protein
MVYHQKLVACIKVNGQVLRESDSTVSIPFGSEYSILLKNLNSKRVQVKVHVDGTDATDGTWLILGPNQSLELERFIRNGNLQSGNRFKFIPRTKQIEQHRGLKADDGLIRIEYKTERVTTTEDVHITRTHHHDVHLYDHYYYPWGYSWPYYPRPWPHNPIIWSVNSGLSGGSGVSSSLGDTQVSYTSSSAQCNANAQVDSCNMMAFNTSEPEPASPTLGAPRFTKSASSSPLRSRSIKAQNLSMQAQAMENDAIDDSGITVPGSESNQQFYSASDFPCHPQTDVIVIKLRGAVGGAPVVKAVTVKTKTTCPTCGKKSKGDKKFCAQCGTSLNIL